MAQTGLEIRVSMVQCHLWPPAFATVCGFSSFWKIHLYANLYANYPYNFLDMAAPVSKVSSPDKVCIMLSTDS